MRTSTTKRPKKLLPLFFGAGILILFSSFYARAFTGPTGSAGAGSGAIGVDSSNSLSIGTSTTKEGVKLLIVGSSTAPGEFAIQILNPSKGPIFLVTNDGRVTIGSTQFASSTNAGGTFGPQPSFGGLFVHGPIRTDLDLKAEGIAVGTTTPQGGGNILATGSITANNIGATITAQNVTTGAFGSCSGCSGGNYSFPVSLGVATTTNVGLPQPLSVYGGGYFSGNVGIGTTGPNAALHVSGKAIVGTFGAAGTYRLTLAGDSAADSELGIVSNIGSLASDYWLWRAVNSDKSMRLLSGSKTWPIDNTNSAMLTVNSSGNVGIGTSTPGQKLTVTGGSILLDNITGLGIRAKRNGDSVEQTILYVANGAAAPVLDQSTVISSIGGSAIQLLPNNSTVNGLTVLSGGNVGIGTAGPGTKLEVVGVASTTELRTPSSTIGTLTVTTCNGCGGGLSGGIANTIPVWTSATAIGNSIISQSASTTIIGGGSLDGALAVGTTTTQAAANIYARGNITTAASFNGNLAANNVTAQVFGAGNFSFPSSLGVNTSTNVTLPQPLSVYGGGYFSGNVGIGTTAWSGSGAKLAVWYNSADDQVMTLRNTNANGLASVRLEDSSGAYKGDVGYYNRDGTIRIGGNTGVDISLVGRNVGIGTATPDAASKLDVRGSVRLGSYNGNGDLFVGASGYAGSVQGVRIGGWPVSDATSSFNTVLYVGSNAGGAGANSVGIGTTNPTSTLTVVGEIKSTTGGFRFPDATVQTTAAGGAVAVSAANVSADVFGRSQGNGNFSFPGSLGVATTSQVGLPQSLSVYGGGYFSGSVGIGTASPSQKVQIVGGALGVFTAAADRGITLNSGITAGTSDIYADYIGGSEPKLHLSTFSQVATANGVTIDTTGNVGIGTTGPAVPLEVLGANNVDLQTRLRSQGTGGSYLQLGQTSQFVEFGVTAAGDFSLNHYGGTSGVFQSVRSGAVANTLYLKAGNVGIGTTGPGKQLVVSGSGATKLSLSKGALFVDSANDGGVLIGSDFAIGSIQGTNAAGTSAKNLMLQNEGGNVGIGTTGPGTKLEVFSAGGGYNRIADFWGNTASAYNYIKVGKAAGAGANAGALFGHDSANNFAFMGNLGDSVAESGVGLIVKSGGNVGIGTTGPGQKLEVAGNVSSTGLCLGGTCNTSWPASGVTSVFGRTGAVVAATGDYGVAQVTGAAPTASPTFTGNVTMPGTGIWNSSGNVGIGISPSYKLHVSGTNTATTGNIYNEYHELIVNPASASTGDYKALYATAESSAAVTIASMASVHGFTNYFAGAAGTLTTGIGVLGGISNGGAGTIGAGSGVTGIVSITAGTISDASALRASTPTKTGGTITRAYGLYIENQNQGTTNYGIYYNTATPCYYLGNGATSWSCTSDVRIKKDILDLSNAVGVINELRPVGFHYKSEQGSDGPLHYGFIAQEYQKVFPQDVSVGPDGYLALAPNSVVPYLVAATQEFSKYIQVGSDGNLSLVAGPNGKVEMNGALQLASAGDRPTCSSDNRGTFWFTKSSEEPGMSDAVQVCMWRNDGYVWTTLTP